MLFHNAGGVFAPSSQNVKKAEQTDGKGGDGRRQSHARDAFFQHDPDDICGWGAEQQRTANAYGCRQGCVSGTDQITNQRALDRDKQKVQAAQPEVYDPLGDQGAVTAEHTHQRTWEGFNDSEDYQVDAHDDGKTDPHGLQSAVLAICPEVLRAYGRDGVAEGDTGQHVKQCDFLPARHGGGGHHAHGVGDGRQDGKGNGANSGLDRRGDADPQ